MLWLFSWVQQQLHRTCKLLLIILAPFVSHVESTIILKALSIVKEITVTVSWCSVFWPVLLLFQNADQCDACRNYKDGPFCVSSCPRDDENKIYKYPNASGICEPCHPNCIDGCTGPENKVGPNGCNSCRVSVLNAAETAVEQCLNETEACPSGYFTSRIAPDSLPQLKGEKVFT